MIKTVYICDICGRKHTITQPYRSTVDIPCGWDHRYKAPGPYAIIELVCPACCKKAQKEWEEAHAGKT